MDYYQDNPIVVDNGANYLKAGYAGDEAPRVSIPMLTGRLKIPKSTGWLIGENARAMNQNLSLTCPISNGIVRDIDELTVIWQYMFMKELRTNPANHAVLIPEYPSIPLTNREKLAEMVFERFNMPGIYFTIQSVLSMYSTGRTTGLSVDMGTEQTNILPVLDTHPYMVAIQSKPIGGTHVTELLRRMLISKHPEAQNSITHEFSKHLKERICYVTLDPKEDLKQLHSTPGSQTNYVTPDGHLINLAQERFMAPEMFFNPSLVQETSSTRGLQFAIHDSISQCPSEAQSMMYSNIVLSGGGSLFTGFPERLENELRHLQQRSSFKKNVTVDKLNHNQLYSVWIGGSILASLSTFRKICIQKSEWHENGPNILQTRCI